MVEIQKLIDECRKLNDAVKTRKLTKGEVGTVQIAIHRLKNILIGMKIILKKNDKKDKERLSKK